MIIANSILKDNTVITDTNLILNNDITYDWINYATTVGVDYFYNRITNEAREYPLELSNNQIIWGGNYFHLPLTKAWVFWDKLVPEGVSFADGELAWTSFDKTLVKVTVPYSGFVGSEGKIHPTQKPVALYKWLLTKYAKPGQTILDTHGGSGSIAIACHDLGFDLTWMELDADYYAAAVKRYTEHARQGRLFDTPPVAPTQGGLF